MTDMPDASSLAALVAKGTLRLRQCRHGVMLYDLRDPRNHEALLQRLRPPPAAPPDPAPR